MPATNPPEEPTTQPTSTGSGADPADPICDLCRGALDAEEVADLVVGDRQICDYCKWQWTPRIRP